MPATITFTSTQAGSNADYFPFLWNEQQALTKTDKYKSAVLCDFALVKADSTFVKLTRGSYIDISSTTYSHWFTGWITTEPSLTYLGAKNSTTGVWGYRYQATSDEYVLSINPLGILQPYYNMSMGAILKSLAAMIAPGMFDVTGISAGPVVVLYVVDPKKKFGDVVKEFCDSAAFLFYGNNKKLFFKAQDDTAVYRGGTLKSIVVDGNDANFSPAQLTINASTSVNLQNDILVTGGIEPQSYVTEYFLGTGLDAAFPLMDSVFGADSTVLLDEVFSSSTVDATKWVINDNVTPNLVISNGYLNCLGGNGTATYDVNIQSQIGRAHV